MRLFLSINFDQDIIAKLVNLKKELQKRNVRGYWRKGDNLHLTLKFLDEVKPQQLPNLRSELKKLVKTWSLFQLI